MLVLLVLWSLLLLASDQRTREVLLNPSSSDDTTHTRESVVLLRHQSRRILYSFCCKNTAKFRGFRWNGCYARRQEQVQIREQREKDRRNILRLRL